MAQRGEEPGQVVESEDVTEQWPKVHAGSRGWVAPTLGRNRWLPGTIPPLDGAAARDYPAPMRTLRFLIGLAGAVVVPPALLAQTVADSGTFVIRHAGDTVATERFARTSTHLEGTLALHNSRSTSQRYSAVVAPDATLPLIEVTVREDADSGRVKDRLVQRARVIFKEDSAAVDAVTGQGLETRIFGTEKGAVPYLNLSFALLEQAVRRSRAGTGSSAVSFFNLGGGQTVSGIVTSISADSLALAIGGVEYRLRVDGEGRVLGGGIPAQGVEVERQ